jgi:Ca2+-binding RTX toxin-like protein
VLNVTGSSGNDSIVGGTAAGGDGLAGADGNDTINGGTTAALINDTLYGGNGDDSLIGGRGADTVFGNYGDDILFGGTTSDAEIDYLDGGEGTGDAVDYGGGTAVTIVMSAPGTGTATFNGGADTLLGIERFRGSTAVDTMTGSSGHGQSQTLADYAEHYIGRGGNDIINGGGTTAGDVDIANYSASTGGVVVNLGAAAIGAVAANTATGDASTGTDTLSNIDGAFGSDFGDTLVGGSSSTGFGGNLFEFFRGGAGNDIIAGSDDALSTVFGGLGTGVDTNDRDLVDYQNSPNGVVVDLRLGIAQDGFGGTDTLFDITHVRGSQFDDYLLGGNAGNDANEFFEGQGGDDHIDGVTGTDTARYINAASAVVANLGLAALATTVQVNGSSVNISVLPGTVWDGDGGTDSLANIDGVHGSDFNDTMLGSSAADRFSGMYGNDSLMGGAGADAFVFQSTLNSVDNLDVIADFLSGTDELELEDAIFTAFAGPIQVAAGNLVQGAGAVALDGDDFLVYDTTTDTLYYDADGNFGGTAVALAQLTGVASLTVNDFTVF